MFRICSDFSENVQNVQNILSMFRMFWIFSQCSECSEFSVNVQNVQNLFRLFRISSTKTGIFRISWLCSDCWYVFLHTALLMLCRLVVPYWQMDQWKLESSNQFSFTIRVITKLPNSEQSYKGKVKTHKYINRQNQSTTGKLWKP
jgi:hypothetical protein